MTYYKVHLNNVGQYGIVKKDKKPKVGRWTLAGKIVKVENATKQQYERNKRKVAKMFAERI